MPYNLGMSQINDAPRTAEAVRYNIKAARECTSLNQKDFAREVGISPTYLCDLEKGRYIPSPEIFAKICRRAGRQPSEFVSL